MPKVAFYTLGCKVNQYESAAMAELFEKKGYEIVDFDDKADVYVINTCDVTNESGRKSRQIIRKAIRKNPSAKVAVVGCYAQLEPNKVSNLPGVSVVVGTKDRHKIVDLVEEAKQTDKQVVAVEDIMKQRTFEEIAFRGHRTKTRAFLKIQEGCNMFCSYCIIPYARGPVRSRAIESIIAEAENLARDGFKEIVLTGIHLGLYGFDFKEEKHHLLEVISRISQIEGIERIRLSSIEALELTDEFLEGLLKIKSFCHHFHIPLQSGCDTVLKRMNRRYSTNDFRNRVNYIRSLMPDASITTDVIVGFPGETEDEFRVTESFIQEMEFSKLHVFPFSARRGTPAADMPNQVEKSVKADRSHRLIHLSQELEQKFRGKFISTIQDVLFEDKKDGNRYEGLTENYIKVVVKSKEDLHNQIIPVKLMENMDDYIFGKIDK
ncbi:tRNA (N(6)-L-threonylcarbamoyladenosine(37)-C(2))-methylthiotransferase MtaB [Tepidanaerobacter sp. GT38]|uniref:tRNA (N(6)-L-threonylcarbamoyladenosine(37)-C(2))- methylthiotransferase MtaB n=1 Tax=Tepidanaerobacter sp. GT38 TaxID=2722793 RepID=UPI001EFFFB63|nr:tRNA (N(6)-L-threonylcarbamoyladenosine(37)-C(2))-methylthiotransferase MtaB [Tepidanaerobacter sp. GT38]MCG1012706.1 tRNA (N(6)-L-threonylcarbamoyladenosine(37)-C(2))-methylthiotransferase MtaB [Tepidanaerobacter sp. GT38]